MGDDGPGKGKQKAAIVTAAGSGMGAACTRGLASPLSDEAGYVAGQNIRVDGGLTRSV